MMSPNPLLSYLQWRYRAAIIIIIVTWSVIGADDLCVIFQAITNVSMKYGINCSGYKSLQLILDLVEGIMFVETIAA